MLDRSGFARGANPAATRENYRRGVQRVARALWSIEVPTIAAINGPAIGLGCDLACMCDIRVAADAALLRKAFKVGLVPGDGGAWFLPRVVGVSKSSRDDLHGDILSASDALACGLVSKVVPTTTCCRSAQTSSRIAAIRGSRCGSASDCCGEPARAARRSTRALRGISGAGPGDRGSHRSSHGFIEKRPQAFTSLIPFAQ